MNTEQAGPRNKEDSAKLTNEKTDNVSGRDAGDDALAETNPSDSRMDEKVIVNEQRENKIVNSPSQTEVHTSEAEDTLD